MKFDELRLEVAISKAGNAGIDPITDEQRKRLVVSAFAACVQLFGDSRFPFAIDDVARAAVRMRKRGKGNVQAWQIAEAHNQWDCFWAERDKGPCSDDVEAGHVVARSAGAGDLTIENGMIECRAHNNQRRDRSIEEYLGSEDNTNDPTDTL